MINKTWKTYLLGLQSNYASWMRLGQQCEGDGLADATEMMQEFYPGNYTIVEKFDPNRGTFSLDLKFENDKDKILWLIKHSHK